MVKRIGLVVVLGACGVGPAPKPDARSVAAVEALPRWDGQTPAPATGQRFIDLADWRESTPQSGPGFHVAALVDTANGQIVWAATVPDGELARFRAGNPVGQIGDCNCRPPPCGCRTCCRPEAVASHLIAEVQAAP